MWIDNLLNSRTRTALELSARFAEQRHRVLAENMANVDVPDYHTRHLDRAAFQDALRDSLAARSANPADGPLKLRGNAQVRQDAAGNLRVKPTVNPAPNLLFHDGTNARLEALAGDVMSNALDYQLTTNLLRGSYETLLSAIRGRVG